MHIFEVFNLQLNSHFYVKYFYFTAGLLGLGGKFGFKKGSKLGMGRYEKYASEGRQGKSVPISGFVFLFLVHSNQTWMFPLNGITIKVSKCTKYGIKVCNFFKFLVCFQYFKFSFHYMF